VLKLKPYLCTIKSITTIFSEKVAIFRPKIVNIAENNDRTLFFEKIAIFSLKIIIITLTSGPDRGQGQSGLETETGGRGRPSHQEAEEHSQFLSEEVNTKNSSKS
jgi:hypothetical protein